VTPEGRLRDYRAADFEAIWALDQACFPPGVAYSRGELRAFLARRTAQAIVAERAGRVVAFVLGGRARGLAGQVVTLDVAAPERRRGLGGRLLAELERRLAAAGATRVELETAVSNRTAIAFYERLGYGKVARLPDYYGPGQDAWAMAKLLGSDRRA
jgi:ribosomal-protein-alanine N-acetyltransferase